MRPLLSVDPYFDAFGMRALSQALYGGADFGECTSTMERFGAGTADDWHREWTDTAGRVEAIGDAAADRGHRVSARECFLRACTYHTVASMPLFGAPVDPRVVAASDRAEAAFAKAAPLCDPPVELLEIPFEGGSLPADLVKADASGAPRPTIVHTNGYDSTIREMYHAHAPAATRRGYHCLLFDGPGQGRCLVRDGLPLRPDWENVVRPVLDFAVGRPEIDDGRIVLAGWSFGGFLAPRAAAFEHRIAALIADPGQWDQREMFLARLPLSGEDKARFPDTDPALLAPMEKWLRSPEGDPMLRWRLLQRGLWVNGAASLHDYFAGMLAYELSPVARDIACPTLLTMAEGDPIAAGAEKLFAALDVENKALVRFTAAEGAGGHCEALARSLYHQRVFDWLDETLA